MDKIEIPFGAYDSETLGWTYTIPKGYTAKVEDGKIIVKKKELEDERIRKEIIDFIQWAEDRGMTRHDYHQAKRPMVWIAYLEKQKEQKVDIDKLRRDLYQSGYNDGYQHGKEDAQKEQKPAIKLVFPRFRVGDIIRNVHDECDKTTKRISYVGEHGYNFDYRHLGDKAGGGSFGFCYEKHYELVEQKPAVEQQGGTFNSYDMAKTFAEGQYYVMKHPEKFCLCKPAEWSEEDEKMLNNVIEHLKVAYCACSWLPEALIWLKSLRPQPKAELTQLDENIIEAAVAFVEQNDHFNVWRGIDKYTVLKALRSLKPYWKPSKEQMCYLKKAYESYDFCDGERDALESLYNDLKKLM